MKNTFARQIFLCCLLAGLSLAWSGCNTVPVTGRSQFVIVTESEEMQLGLTSFEQMKKETPISKDAAANALLQKVGQRIAAIAQKDMPNAKWEFVVFESKEMNAFCLPGGKVGVYTGILPVTKDEAGLATVLGHEIAHAVARHGGERMSEAMVIQAGGNVLGAAVSKASPLWQSGLQLAYGAGTQLGSLKFSRNHESEADRMGLSYMAEAGYDPEAAVKFWQRFAEISAKQGNDTPALLRTHPTDETRIKQLQALMPEAKAKYKPVK